MAGDVTRDELQLLATRTGILEREVEGEKMVTRHILEQTRRNGDDLATIKTQLGQVETRLGARIDGVESRIDGVESRLGRVESKVDRLARNLPEIVGEVIREAFREERQR